MCRDLDAVLQGGQKTQAYLWIAYEGTNPQSFVADRQAP